MNIERELRHKQFKTEFQKAHINILYSASCLSAKATAVLKPYNLSWQQFNIMRILKGIHPKPATIKQLTLRMIDKMSNASRLVEKLHAKGLVQRKTSVEDRRQLNVQLTQNGQKLLEEVSKVMSATFEYQLGDLSPTEAAQLNALLNKMRQSE